MKIRVFYTNTLFIIDWKLMMLYGNDIYFGVPAAQGDPDYVAFWDRVQNKREETVVNNVGDGIKALREGQHVFHISERMLKRYFLEHPYIQQPIKVFGKEKPQFKTIIVTLNSPLKPIFEFGFKTLMQGGTTDRILKKWEGPDLADVPVETMVLNFGQVLLGFIVIGFISSLAILVFLIEYVWHKSEDVVMDMLHAMKKSRMLNKLNLRNKHYNKMDEKLLFTKRTKLEKRLLKTIHERNSTFI